MLDAFIFGFDKRDRSVNGDMKAILGWLQSYENLPRPPHNLKS